MVLTDRLLRRHGRNNFLGNGISGRYGHLLPTIFVRTNLGLVRLLAHRTFIRLEVTVRCPSQVAGTLDAAPTVGST